MLEDLNEFIHSNPDARELKRALAVRMYLQGAKHRDIQESLGVSSGFISKWTKQYKQLGIPGLKLKYTGSKGHLRPEQRAAVIQWLIENKSCNLKQLASYLKQEYEVKFDSKQSYYTLLKQAGNTRPREHKLQQVKAEH